MSFIAKQPNGLYCRYSSDTNTISDYNMTDEDYINMCKEKAMQKAEQEARDILNNYVRDMGTLNAYYLSNEKNNKDKFNDLIKEMNKPKQDCVHVKLGYDTIKR